MKTTLLLLGAMWIGSAQAQYFTHTYGQSFPIDDKAMKGITSTSLPGYIMVGEGSNVPFTTTQIVHANAIGTPIVNSWYEVYDASGAQRNSKPDDIEEHNGFIYVVGRLGSNNAYLLKVNSTTGAVTAREYSFVSPLSAFTNVNICKSNNSSDLFITGTINAPSMSPSIFEFAMRVDNNGDRPFLPTYWDFIYFSGNPNPNPTAPPILYENECSDAINTNFSTTGELVLAGTANPPGLGNNVASMLYINPTTGVPIGTGYVEHDFGGPVRINDINIAAANGGGYVMAGSYFSGNYDALAINTDVAGTINWSTTFDQSHMPGGNNEAKSIVERLNTFNNYEYYTAGYAERILPTFSKKGQVLKIDQAGNLVPNGEFLKISVPMYEDNALVAIDNDFTPNNGFVAFGQEYKAAGSDYEMEITKAYYNGIIDPIVPCGFTSQNIPYGPIGHSIRTPIYAINSGIFMLTASAKPNSMNARPGCFTTSDPSGDNSLVGTKKPEPVITRYDAANSALIFAIDMPLPSTEQILTIDLKIMDITGKLILNQTKEVSSTTLTNSLAFDHLTLAAGMYVGVVTMNGKQYSQKFLVNE